MLRPAFLFRFCNSVSKALCRISSAETKGWRQNSQCTQKGDKEKEKQKQPLMDINGKTAIITGGSSGIGLAAAEQLLSHGAAHVFLSSVDSAAGVCAEKSLKEKFGADKCTFVFGDVRDEDHFTELFERCIEKCDNVDILFNNAGILKDKLWRETVDINLTGIIRGCFLGFKYMGKNECGKGGVIINCSSIVGLQTLPTAPAYSSTKHGIIGVTLSFGDEYHHKDTGIRVTAVCPGVTETVLVAEALDHQYKKEWGVEAERFLKSYPRQQPEALGKAVVCIVKWAPTATVWVVEDTKLYRADIPDRASYSKLVKELK